jgi:hypothetical protein
MMGIWESRFHPAGPDFGDPAVHHVRRGHHVGTGLGMGQGRPGQKIQGTVVVDGMAVHKAAVAVVGILAQADIGDHASSGSAVFDGANGPLDDAVFGVGLGAQRGLFVDGMPKRIMAGNRPGRMACLATLTRLSMDCWYWPGMASMGF